MESGARRGRTRRGQIIKECFLQEDFEDPQCLNGKGPQALPQRVQTTQCQADGGIKRKPPSSHGDKAAPAEGEGSQGHRRLENAELGRAPESAGGSLIKITVPVEVHLSFCTNQTQEENRPDVKGLKELECP